VNTPNFKPTTTITGITNADLVGAPTQEKPDELALVRQEDVRATVTVYVRHRDAVADGDVRRGLEQ
jgi:hypothetical protein